MVTQCVKGSDYLKIKEMNINDLTMYENNPRNNDEAVKYVAKSIKNFGFLVPLVIDKNNVIVAGHTRYKASKELNLDKVPCVIADDLTEKQIKAFRLADNKVSEFSQWDNSLLDLELSELTDLDIDMSDFGFDLDSLDLEEQEIIEDEVPEIPENPKAKYGDIYQLGNHRLMCGDSTNKEDVEKLMNGEKADMVFTDPPYGVNVKGGKGKGNTIMGDLTSTAIPFAFEIAVTICTKEKSHFYFCGGETNIQLYQKLFDRYLHILPKHLIWVKNGFVMKQSGYHNQYEIIYHGYKVGSGGLWYGGRTEDEASDVWQIKRDSSSTYLHPTQKPIDLPLRAIKNSTPKNGLVVDLFGGSGSTLIACEQLGRACYAMELDPHYVDVILKRWEQFTGQEAVKLNG